jgi:hypothetical protein
MAADIKRLRIAPGMSPSGSYWRCAVTPASNISRFRGAHLVDFATSKPLTDVLVGIAHAKTPGNVSNANEKALAVSFGGIDRPTTRRRPQHPDDAVFDSWESYID